MNKKALFKLVDYLNRNSIDYAITGTTALSILGFPSSFVPADIDVKVYNLNEEQASILAELEALSGLEKPQYEDGVCYSFMVCGIKVNAISSEKSFEEACQLLKIETRNRHNFRSIYVQNVELALTEKMKLGRFKDTEYLLDAVKNLTNL